MVARPGATNRYTRTPATGDTKLARTATWIADSRAGDGPSILGTRSSRTRPRPQRLMTDSEPNHPIPNYIDGAWTAAAAAESLAVTDPASGERLGTVPLSTPSDVDAAVRAATAAFPGWQSTPAVERARVLFRLKALMDEHRDELAQILTREHGKTLGESRGEIQRGIENIEHACGIPALMMGETLEDIAPGIDCETVRQPLGVFAVITPYNFPVMIPLWFWPYAVATGNTVVLKPSEQDPLTHQRIVDLATEAGLPPGVLNVVHGGVDAVETLLDHDDVVGVSFVGSSHIAKIIYSRAAASGKRVQALGGAKNHMIVLPDADLEPTVDALVGSLYGAAGQRCLAGSVIVGVGDAYGPVRESFLEKSSSLRMGHGLDEGTQMGPLVSARHRDRVQSYVDKGTGEGAKLALDGRGTSVDGYPDGHFFGPTVFEDVHPAMELGREEILRPGGRPVPGGLLRGRDRPDARGRLRQRDFDLHHEREGSAGVQVSGGDQHDGGQHRRCGADGVLPLRRIAGVVLRRPEGSGQ